MTKNDNRKSRRGSRHGSTGIPSGNASTDLTPVGTDAASAGVAESPVPAPRQDESTQQTQTPSSRVYRNETSAMAAWIARWS